MLKTFRVDKMVETLYPKPSLYRVLYKFPPRNGDLTLILTRNSEINVIIDFLFSENHKMEILFINIYDVLIKTYGIPSFGGEHIAFFRYGRHRDNNELVCRRKVKDLGHINI